MEEYDDLIPQPDNEGRLDLAHRAWRVVDSVIWTLGRELIFLDLSYNKLEVLPQELGNLYLLRELDVSSNRIANIPREIMRCKRLRVLKANGNEIAEVPHELGHCRLLEELYLSENQISEIPGSIGALDGLQTLTLQNNHLAELPPELGLCVALKRLDCSNNPGLLMIPEKLRGDLPMILWICKTRLDNRNEVDSLLHNNDQLENMLRVNDEEKLRLQDKLHDLQEKNEILMKERPELYLAVKGKVTGVVSEACTIC
mmetsp:Transcript_11488/g.34871  ORF Transcript_11488/g.34871 Transcript_11488/m.34871 type:complete len:257 (-) Transcript_11488:425-1195(-)